MSLSLARGPWGVLQSARGGNLVERWRQQRQGRTEEPWKSCVCVMTSYKLWMCPEGALLKTLIFFTSIYLFEVVRIYVKAREQLPSGGPTRMLTPVLSSLGGKHPHLLIWFDCPVLFFWSLEFTLFTNYHVARDGLKHKRPHITVGGNKIFWSCCLCRPSDEVTG